MDREKNDGDPTPFGLQARSSRPLLHIPRTNEL
jgi:hypothetical protein